MLKHHISGMPVIDTKGKLVGIVTEGDFLRRPEIDTERRCPGWREAVLVPSEAARNYVHSHGVKVKDVMTQNPVSVAEDIPLDRVVQLMESRNVKAFSGRAQWQGDRDHQPRQLDARVGEHSSRG
jgi:CBS domain-containing protein